MSKHQWSGDQAEMDLLGARYPGAGGGSLLDLTK